MIRNHHMLILTDRTHSQENGGPLHKHKECVYILFYQQQQVEDKMTGTCKL